jgi:cyclin-A
MNSSVNPVSRRNKRTLHPSIDSVVVGCVDAPEPSSAQKRGCQNEDPSLGNAEAAVLCNNPVVIVENYISQYHLYHGPAAAADLSAADMSALSSDVTHCHDQSGSAAHGLSQCDLSGVDALGLLCSPHMQHIEIVAVPGSEVRQLSLQETPAMLLPLAAVGGIHPVDALDSNDPQACSEYAGVLYENLHQSEQKLIPWCNYMVDRQRDITTNMRAILVDWLVEVSQEYHLQNETLYLSINFLDRFLCHEQVLRGKLQLVGITCLFIASKYEEMTPQTVDEFVYITDNTYDRAEVLDMERKILVALKFELTAVTSITFLRRYCKMLSLDTTTSHLAAFLLELTLLDYFFMDARPSIVALGAVCVAVHHQKEGRFPATIIPRLGTSHPFSDIELAATHVHRLHTSSRSLTLRAVVDKYSRGKYTKVATLVPRASFSLHDS